MSHCPQARTLRQNAHFARVELGRLARRASGGSRFHINAIPDAKAYLEDAVATLTQHESSCSDCEEQP